MSRKHRYKKELKPSREYAFKQITQFEEINVVYFRKLYTWTVHFLFVLYHNEEI